MFNLCIPRPHADGALLTLNKNDNSKNTPVKMTWHSKKDVCQYHNNWVEYSYFNYIIGNKEWEKIY